MDDESENTPRSEAEDDEDFESEEFDTVHKRGGGERILLADLGDDDEDEIDIQAELTTKTDNEEESVRDNGEEESEKEGKVILKQ